MGCITDKTISKGQIYSINISQQIDPKIQQESAPSLKINNSVVCSVTKDYFLSSQSKTTNIQKALEKVIEIDPIIKKRQSWKVQYDECIYLYALHQIDKANRLAQILLISITTIQIEDKTIYELDLKKITNQYKKVNRFQAEVAKSGWQFKGQSKGIRVSSKRETDTVAVLIQAEINIPVQILAAVLTQVDLFYKFVPFMQSSKQLKVCARNAKIGHCINNLPIISKRQAFFFGVGYDRLQHNGSIFIYTESLLQNPQLMKEHNFYPKITQGAVQLDYKYLIFQYSPKDEKSGNVRLAINVDMKLPFVPMFIMDPVTRDFGFDFFKNMVKISKNFENSQWKTKVQNRPDLFNFFKDRVQQFVANN